MILVISWLRGGSGEPHDPRCTRIAILRGPNVLYGLTTRAVRPAYGRERRTT
jgi:hypothetical protein